MKSVRTFVLVLTFVAVGCASSKAPGEVDDSGVGPPIDAGSDGSTGDGFGDECTEHGDCASGICYREDLNDEAGICTEECTGNCPDGYACRVVQIADFTDARVCVPAQETMCDQCDTNQDCGDSSDFCIQLTGGGFCTIDCEGNPGICPVGFTCQTVAGSGDTVVGMQCMPLNGICCIDGDGDLRGEGEGCITTDCDDTNGAIYDDAIEICDGFDNDCVGGVDVDPTDCAAASCQLGQLGYFERPAEPCQSADCTGQSAILCDLYTCSDGGEDGDACATACDGEDNGKCVPAAHCDASACLDDLADGLQCDETSDCESDHCQNAFCCAFGDCCQVAQDCPTFGTEDAVCENPTTCQGTRGEAVCTNNYTCATTGLVQDDSACTAQTEANPCGWYLSKYCTGGVNQSSPQCPTTCSSHADCDVGGHCDPATSTCIADLPDGMMCANDDARCQSDHCANGFCCGAGTCCATESDCPGSFSSDPVCTLPGVCQGEADVAQCLSYQCATSFGVGDDSACNSMSPANNCGPYLPVYCDGNSVQNPPECATSCTNDLDCDANAYCNTSGVCVLDEPNGDSCNDNAECQSAHCQNGYCCATGDCCGGDVNCNGYDIAPDCDNTTTCQGTRTDGVCNASSQCAAQSVNDDSACNGQESSACGPYPSTFCSASQNQTPPVCTSMCMVDTDCDPSAHCDNGVCVPDEGPGGFCDEPSDCTASLTCVDSVCCNSSCNLGCEACDLVGSEGTCTRIPNGQDPDSECGAVSCSGYYAGWTGDTCYTKADVPAVEAMCNGTGQCRSTATECGLQTDQGMSSTTCNATCQDPNLSTCTNTTNGACTNVNPGNQSCGQGQCFVTVPQCANGAPNTCTAGNPSTETCNNLDDNCDGTTDNGAFSDWAEPNGACGSYTSLATVGSNNSISYTNLTLYGSGDQDYFRIPATETDSSCSCCDLFCFDEDYQLNIWLTVPAGAGSYMFCTGDTCGNVNGACQEVLAGQTRGWTWTLDGACPGNDSYSRYVRIYGDNAPGFECSPYTLSYDFDPGCF